MLLTHRPSLPHSAPYSATTNTWSQNATSAGVTSYPLQSVQVRIQPNCDKCSSSDGICKRVKPGLKRKLSDNAATLTDVAAKGRPRIELEVEPAQRTEDVKMEDISSADTMLEEIRQFKVREGHESPGEPEVAAFEPGELVW